MAPPRVITLWDFTWYTRTGPGEPFADLDAACAQARERGYTTIRLCAMPYLLFRSGIDVSALTLGPLGGRYGQNVRWYEVRSETTIDAREHLLALFRSADRHNLDVIASSWEYQQSSALATRSDWFDSLQRIAPDDRAVVLADAHADLVDLLDAEGLGHRLVMSELHNEVQYSGLVDGLGVPRGDQAVVALTDRLERGLARFHLRHPGRPATVSYAGVPVSGLRALPRGMDALAVHPYVYGVLDEFINTFGVRAPSGELDVERLRDILRPGAPALAQWGPGPENAWKLRATVVPATEFYVHEWSDPEIVDRWLYDRWGVHRLAMQQKLTLWLEVAADWAAARGVPLILGEGYIGYTPTESTFEGGPIGAEFCRHAMREARRLHAWGAVICSNAAPHHSMWSDIALQRQCAALLQAPTSSH
ncbi:MAG: cellulase-like family protein [Propionicimonas sp.]